MVFVSMNLHAYQESKKSLHDISSIWYMKNPYFGLSRSDAVLIFVYAVVITCLYAFYQILFTRRPISNSRNYQRNHHRKLKAKAKESSNEIIVNNNNSRNLIDYLLEDNQPHFHYIRRSNTHNIS